MSTEQPIRFAPWLGILLIALTAINVVGVLLVSGSIFRTILALALFVMALLLYFRPQIVVTPDEVQKRAITGAVRKTYPLTGPDDLYFDGDALVHRPSERKVANLGFWMHPGDVAALRARVNPPGI